MNPTTESLLTCLAVSPVMSVLRKTTQKQVENEQCKGKHCAHTKSYVETLIVTRLVLIIKRIGHKLCLVI